MARGRRQAGEGELDAALLEEALDRQAVGIALISLPGLVFEYANDAFQGFAPGQEMVGRNALAVFPEMAFLAPRVLTALDRGETWREEDAVSAIRRSPEAALETVYGAFEVTRLEAGGHAYLLVNAVESAERAGLAREYELLRHERERRLELAEALNAVYRVMHSSLDYDEVMQRALEEATRVLGANAGAVFVGIDGESEARYVTGFPKSLLGRRFSGSIFPFSEIMERTRDPVAIPAREMGKLMNPALARVFRVRSLLAIPIVTRGTLVGGIGLVYRKPHEFVTPEIDFARAFGVSLSLALENADLYRRQERVADTLQQALLTLPKEIEGIDFAHAYLSATEAVVGGDFYDLFELEHGLIGISLGDIAGKGLDAAVLTSLVKNAIRVQATERRGDPGEVMRIANSVVASASEPEEFATVFFGLLDRPTGRLVYCNAGHTTSATLCRDGRIERLEANSPIVGAFPDSVFEESDTVLAPGDTLFLYTDGLTEARSGKDLFGEERVFAVLEEGRDGGPDELVRRMLAAVEEYTGGELNDDLALLALKRRL